MTVGTDAPTIEQAITALAGMDTDGARIRNGVGFNGSDSAFGRSLAFQIGQGKTLSAKQRAAAYRMLRKYQGQLTNDHGIDFNTIPEPERAAPDLAVTGLAVMGDGFIGITFNGYPKHLLPVVKAVPGAKWSPVDRVWRLPVTDVTAEHIEVFPDQIIVEDEVKAWVATVAGSRSASVAASRATDAELPGLSIADAMFPFQRAGVRYAVEHERTFIGDDMGLGKTVQALATIEITDSYPALLVVPAVVKLNWRNEVGKWFPHRKVEVVNGRAPKPTEGGLLADEDYALPHAELIVVNYDILASWAPLLKRRGFKAVVFDESHYLKSPKAQRTKAAKAVASDVRYRLLLTGTPILNRPVELVAQLDVMGRLRDFGGARGFQVRFCDAHQGRFGWDANGASNLTELHERLRSSCLVRRTKDQVLTELPDKLRSTVVVELADRRRYEKVKRDLKVWLKQRILDDEKFWRELANVDEADREAEVKARRKLDAMRRAEALVKIEALKQTVAEEKLPNAIAWLDDFLTSEKKIVVFAHHRKILDALREHLGPKAVSVTGETKAEDRQLAVERFQSDPDVRVFLGNIQAAGVGITLTAASDVAFLELPWRPGDLSQAEDRCHRIGQDDSVTCWYLLAGGTIETRIAAMIDSKRVVVDAATDGKTGIDPGESIQNALMDALGQDEDDEEGW